MPAMDGNDLDPRPEEAARPTLEQPERPSPEVAAALAGGGRRRGPRPGRIAALAALASVALAGLWFAGSSLRRRAAPAAPASEPAAEVDRSVYLLPLRTEAAAAGEETAPFTGFAVSIDSDPPGALVAIAGKARGEAPVLANLSCRPGERIEVRAERKGYRPARHAVACRADTLVKLTLRLEK